MAWITKDSAHAPVEKRDEPYLTADMRKHLSETIIPRYETPRAATLPCLHEIQHTYGWVPKQAMIEIAELLNVTPSHVLDTASFYEEYWLHPKGAHTIAVCRSIACEFCNATSVTEAVKAKLDIDVGETTEDNQFTLVELECIGACGGGPAILIDETLFEHVTPDHVCALIDDVAAGKSPVSNAYTPLTTSASDHH